MKRKGSAGITWFGVVGFLAWLIYPNTKRKDAMQPFLSFDYAHRGLHGEGVPENSIAAFERAVKRGYGSELDVQLSLDGVPVVFHDDTLDRMCHVSGRVEEKTFEELRLPLEGSEEMIPVLSQVLKTVDAKTPLIIELKATKRKRELVEAVLGELIDYPGMVLLESFDPRIMSIVKKVAPSVLRGQLSGGLFRNKRNLSHLLADGLLWNVYSRPDFIAYQHRFGRRYLLLYSKIFGTPIISFTIKNQRQYHLKKWFSSHIFEGFLPTPKHAQASRADHKKS